MRERDLDGTISVVVDLAWLCLHGSSHVSRRAPRTLATRPVVGYRRFPEALGYRMCENNKEGPPSST